MCKFALFAAIVSLIAVANCASTTTITDSDGNQVKVKCQPIYGNWCGKGYPAYEVTGFKPNPVDKWDEACKEHDLCYDEYGESGQKSCDRAFSQNLEYLDMRGIPAPHQITNAYNYFKENKPYRSVFVTFKDLWDASTVSCEGGEGIPTVFCDVGRDRDNCEVGMGFVQKGARCFCDYPNLHYPFGVIPGGRFWGIQKTADDF